MFNLSYTNFYDFEFNNRNILFYPTLTFLYYKYFLHYNLLVLDMYYTFPETSEYFGTSIISNNLFRQFDMYDNTYPNDDNLNIALNEIPT